MSKNKTPVRPDIGGQAVLDGVMMKSPDAIAVAVRRPDGSIVVKRDSYTAPSKKHPWMGLPFIRGTVNLVQMFSLGMRVLNDSAAMAGVEEEEPGKFEKWLSKTFGKSIDKVVMAVAAVLAVCLSVGLFVLLPNLVVMLFPDSATGGMLLVKNLVSALMRTAILIAYMILCAKVPDVRRTFQYHGSEHKTVYCNEHDLPLTPKNAQQFSTLHPRCGTSFILITFFVSLIFYFIFDVLVLTVTGYDLGANYFLRILSRVILLPLVAGISYETLKGLAHNNGKVCRALRWPGLMMQKLTTKPPTDDMCQVAIVSMETALRGLPEGEKTPEGWVILPADSPKAQPLPAEVLKKREDAAKAEETNPQDKAAL